MVEAASPAPAASWLGAAVVVPAGFVPPNSPVVGAGVVVAALAVVAGAPVVVVVAVGAVVDAGFANGALVAAGVAELVAAVEVAGFVPNKPEPTVAEVAGAALVGAVPKRPGAAAVEEAAGAAVVGAVVGAGTAPAVIPKSGFAPVCGTVVEGVVVPEVVGAPNWAPLNSDGVPPVAGVWPSFGAKILLDPAPVPLPGCACVVVEAGVADCPNRLPVLAAGAAGLDPRAAPNRSPADLEAPVGGAPAGVVEPSPPNSGFAGVDCVPGVPAAGAVEPNIAPPVFTKSAPPVEGVAAPEGDAVVADPNRLPVVAPCGPVAGTADVGVEELPNTGPAGLPAPPNNPAPDEAPVVWPNIGVLVEGAEIDGVAVVVELPKRPPF